MALDAAQRYKLRREIRLFMRGMDGHFRMDADEGEEEQENNNSGRGRRGGGGGEGHGNTRLPFGLCQRFGIEIGKDWGPKEAWDALAGKGITADGAYARLKEGKDPGTPPEGGDEGSTPEKEEKVEETPAVEKEPAKTIEDGGRTYSKIELEYRDWSKEAPYSLIARDEEGHALWKRFSTRADMMWYLRDKGVEQVSDPETGEVVNPQKMELPERLFRKRGYSDTWYSAVSIGLRKGRYVVIGTGMDGKKTTVDDYRTIAGAREWLAERGVPEDKIKLSPSVKKREEERTAWLTSDKQEWVMIDNKKYGDLKCSMFGGTRYVMECSTENGEIARKMFSGKTELMKYLKEQGVERCKVDDEYVNPQEYKIPDTIARIEGVDYQEFHYRRIAGGDALELIGKDLDGYNHSLLSMGYRDSFEKFEKAVSELYGLDESKITIDDDMRKHLEYMRQRDVDLEKFEERFKKEAVKIGYHECVDLRFEKTDRGYAIFGTDEDGDQVKMLSAIDGEMRDIALDLHRYGVGPEKIKMEGILKDLLEHECAEVEDFYNRAVKIGREDYVDVKVVRHGAMFALKGTDEWGDEEFATSAEDMYKIDEILTKAGVDPKTAMNDDIYKEYQEYKKSVADFESKAKEYKGEKYAGMGITAIGDTFVLFGYDIRGRKRELDSGNYEELKGRMEAAGISQEDAPMDDQAVEYYKFREKEKAGVASGEYSWVDGHAYKDFVIKSSSTRRPEFRVTGIDMNDENKSFDSGLLYDDAIDYFESRGITNYKIYDDASGTYIDRPKNGIRRVRMLRTPDGVFTVMATTGKDQRGVVYTASSENEARQWIKDQGVDDSNIKTRGMNPNDDAPRTHSMLSLAGFDDHRMKKVDNTMIDQLSEDEKKETAEMLTDMFDQGSYRMNRSDNFLEIVTGHFKNLLETGTSGGSDYKPGRRETGVQTFGHDYDIEAEEAEKYGFWGIESDEEYSQNRTASGYGGISFKFKKDKVAERTTYTFGDSLDSGRPLAGYAGAHPTIEGITGLDAWRGGKDKLGTILDYYRQYKGGNMSFNQFYEAVNDECIDGYVECQFHGMLTIEDVESVTFPDNTFSSTFRRMTPDERKTVVTKLKDNGIILNYWDYANKKMRDGYEVLREMFGEVETWN